MITAMILTITRWWRRTQAQAAQWWGWPWCLAIPPRWWWRWWCGEGSGGSLQSQWGDDEDLVRLAVVPRNLNEVLPPLSRSPAYSSSSYIYPITPICLIFIMFLVIKPVVLLFNDLFSTTWDWQIHFIFKLHLAKNVIPTFLTKIILSKYSRLLQASPTDWKDDLKIITNRTRQGGRREIAVWWHFGVGESQNQMLASSKKDHNFHFL